MFVGVHVVFELLLQYSLSLNKKPYVYKPLFLHSPAVPSVLMNEEEKGGAALMSLQQTRCCLHCLLTDRFIQVQLIKSGIWAFIVQWR